MYDADRWPASGWLAEPTLYAECGDLAVAGTRRISLARGYVRCGSAVRIDTGEGSLLGVPFTMEVNDMPLYVRYGNEPDAFTHTLARIVEGWIGWAIRSHAWTSPCTRMFSADRTARSLYSIHSRW